MKIKLKICSGCGLPKQIWKNVGREKFNLKQKQYERQNKRYS